MNDGMDKSDYNEISVAGRQARVLSIWGMNKLRHAMGLAPIPSPEPGEDPEAYKARIRPHRANTFRMLRHAPAELVDRLFGPGAKELAKEYPLEEVFFFPEGQVAAVDAAGEQVPREQEMAWVAVLKEKISRGVVDDSTLVYLPGAKAAATLKELRARHGF